MEKGHRKWIVALFCLFCAAVAAGCSVSPPEPLSEESIGEETAKVDSAANETLLDPQLSDYQPIGALTGRITTVGSDTMNNLMALWVEGFKQFYPEVEFEIESKGSSTAIPALIAGGSTFGPMSRDLKSGEIDSFQAKFGYKPVQIPTSIDMLAVYVNKDNPLKALSLPQVDALFSKSQKLGFPNDITVWGQTGLAGPWAEAAISLYGRNAASGTYGYFKDHVLAGGDFKDSVKEQPGSSSVVQAVGSDPNAIGYSGIGYRTADVRPLALSTSESEPAVEAEPENAYSGQYPLARHLWLTVNYRPGSKLESLPAEFLRYVLSRQGQAKVVEDGYLPLRSAAAHEALRQVGID